MKYITSEQIEKLNISSIEAVDWARKSFLLKPQAQLPPKVSLHPQGDDFINTMPCILPAPYNLFGCKVVCRIKGSVPALKSDMMLVDTSNGRTKAFVNADWITTMRTAAVAVLAINTLRKSDAEIYSFVGLGVIGNATLNCLLETNKDRSLHIRLMRYKNHAENAIEKYKSYDNVTFSIAESYEELVQGADVVVSCITSADGLMVEDTDLFKPGVLLVPVHTRGFQNCDSVFDKVVADDRGHVKGFKYYESFKNFRELTDVLSGELPGRESDEERILSYNIGLGLHDLVYAWHILNLLDNSEK